jgi:hypothetical protein
MLRWNLIIKIHPEFAHKICTVSNQRNLQKDNDKRTVVVDLEQK